MDKVSEAGAAHACGLRAGDEKSVGVGGVGRASSRRYRVRVGDEIVGIDGRRLGASEYRRAAELLPPGPAPFLLLVRRRYEATPGDSREAAAPPPHPLHQELD